MTVDRGDWVIILRGIMGAIVGAASFLSYSYLSIYTFILPLVFYVASIIVVRSIYPDSGKWLLFGKGISTFIIAWLLLWIILVQ